ncbi:hypothetical protein [Pontibacter fetidus]|uniref:Uncharacterized protein n=1 Tax=Pontibacter fetidus TaxID=2700082 RepID=A0A6B2H931_9BACT|nr:hypothetical protein [Pontibacter fetidus]NDK57177.1 hypothetical protein [Pontibacter fetidus]
MKTLIGLISGFGLLGFGVLTLYGAIVGLYNGQWVNALACCTLALVPIGIFLKLIKDYFKKQSDYPFKDEQYWDDFRNKMGY